MLLFAPGVFVLSLCVVWSMFPCVVVWHEEICRFFWHLMKERGFKTSHFQLLETDSKGTDTQERKTANKRLAHFPSKWNGWVGPFETLCPVRQRSMASDNFNTKKCSQPSVSRTLWESTRSVTCLSQSVPTHKKCTIVQVQVQVYADVWPFHCDQGEPVTKVETFSPPPRTRVKKLSSASWSRELIRCVGHNSFKVLAQLGDFNTEVR